MITQAILSFVGVGDTVVSAYFQGNHQVAIFWIEIWLTIGFIIEYPKGS
jgi:hypothetical protein